MMANFFSFIKSNEAGTRVVGFRYAYSRRIIATDSVDRASKSCLHQQRPDRELQESTIVRPLIAHTAENWCLNGKPSRSL